MHTKGEHTIYIRKISELLRCIILVIIKIDLGRYYKYVGFTNLYKCLIILIYMMNERGR